MKQRLQQNSVNLIHDSLKDDVVLKVVDICCKQFESRMNVMRFSTTEIYIESVSLLDEIRRQSTDFDFRMPTTIFYADCATTTRVKRMLMQGWLHP